jgi:spore germination cell wall hydrolase CwlJ-like protein
MTSLNKKFFEFFSIRTGLAVFAAGTLSLASTLLGNSVIERNNAQQESIDFTVSQQLKEQQALELKRVQLVNERLERHVSCLAKNIYYEAGSESRTGKIAVANVTLNRAASGKFPNDVCDVVYQRRSGTCQFSWVCDKGKHKPYGDSYQESKSIARMVLTRQIKPVIGKNVLYYHADYVNPNWDLQRVIKIGAHIFYTET